MPTLLKGSRIAEVFADEAGTEIWSLVMLAERLDK